MKELLLGLPPQQLIFPDDESWFDGMKELAILGKAFGLPEENTCT